MASGDGGWGSSLASHHNLSTLIQNLRVHTTPAVLELSQLGRHALMSSARLRCLVPVIVLVLLGGTAVAGLPVQNRF